jgi:hypothetical protein
MASLSRPLDERREGRVARTVAMAFQKASGGGHTGEYNCSSLQIHAYMHADFGDNGGPETQTPCPRLQAKRMARSPM